MHKHKPHTFPGDNDSLLFYVSPYVCRFCGEAIVLNPDSRLWLQDTSVQTHVTTDSGLEEVKRMFSAKRKGQAQQAPGAVAQD